jgi:formate hydrogenlyase subunit 3/multisubunit Na+/H+ antiporter MnhD subunit
MLKDTPGKHLAAVLLLRVSYRDMARGFVILDLLAGGIEDGAFLAACTALSGMPLLSGLQAKFSI